jgi:LacI family gluconate utilization system Gnt-I transcriptional repressor
MDDKKIIPMTKDIKTPTRPLTLKDVSEASGVSEMTVSRVLRNRGDVSEATRKKVLATAKELGYVPNKIAGALASNRVNLVAVIIPSLSNMVFPQVLTGVSDVLDASPLQSVVGVTHYKPETEEKVLFEMLSWRPSGIILAGLEHTDASNAMLAASGIPVVEIMDTDGDPIDSVVGISHRRAGREMARQILRYGYEQIGFLGTKMPMDHRARKRFEGFTEALAKEGVEVVDQEFYDGGSSLLKGREMTARILERTPELDFLYYSNDMIGAGGLLHLLDQGIEVPGQIGLAAFNGTDLLDGLSVQLATMEAGRYEIGRKAAEIILERNAENATESARRIELTPQIQLGDTLKRT